METSCPTRRVFRVFPSPSTQVPRYKLRLGSDNFLRHPVANHPAANHPVANHPVANHPVANHPVANHPVANHPVANHPVANHHAVRLCKAPAIDVVVR